MKKAYKMSLSWIFAVGLIFGSIVLNAQSASDLSKLLQTSQEDASKLIGAYTSPVVRAVSYGMTGGWYHTGKTHNKLGFDIGVTMNTVFTPSSDNYFNPASLGLKATSFNGNTTHPGMGAPTFLGPKDKTSYTSSYDPDGTGPILNQTIPFNGPEGLDMKKSIGFQGVPVPMLQLGIGLFFNTDLKVRYVNYSRSGNKIQMLGFGLMHDIKQHIPGIKLLPFDLSVLLAYNHVNGSTDLSHGPNPDGIPESTDGKTTYKLNSYVGQVVISKKVSVLTFYAGVGYGSVASNADITGTFTITSGNPGPDFQIKDPAKIDYKNNSMKLTGGMRLKFGPIYLVGDYTLQKYNSFAFGIGVSVR